MRLAQKGGRCSVSAQHSPIRDVSQRGFTMMEIVLAVTLLAIILSVSYSGITSIITSKQLLDDRRDQLVMANSVLNRMTRELQLAFSGVAVLPRPDEDKDKKIASSICLIGDENMLGNDKRGDVIRFVALEGGQYLPDGGSHSGLVQIMYRVEEDPERKPNEPERYLLIREETPVIRPFDRAYEKMMVFPITNRIISMQLRYYDTNSQKWYGKWGDGERNDLPARVEIIMELMSPRGVLQRFATQVPLRRPA